MACPEQASCEAVVDGNPSLSPEDKAELERQRNLLHGSFAYISEEKEETVRIPRLAIVVELRKMADDIHDGTKMMEDFWTYQELHIDDPAYEFLSENHPGLNVAGWRVFMALIDPLAYGREIQAAGRTRGSISRRSRK